MGRFPAVSGLVLFEWLCWFGLGLRVGSDLGIEGLSWIGTLEDFLGGLGKGELSIMPGLFPEFQGQ